MPSKKVEKDSEEKPKPKCRVLTCGVKSPGPKYKLKTLVGYDDHCHSKHRNPAYTIGRVHKRKDLCVGPGPKYLYNLPGIPGYTFPKAVYREVKACSPGPKYMLPECRGPAYSITPRFKAPCTPATSGPYDPYPICPGPAFTIIGARGGQTKCPFDPAIRDVGAVDLVRPRGPSFRITPRVKERSLCVGPGPKYLPKLCSKAPEYSFGLKHSECETLPRTECDELC